MAVINLSTHPKMSNLQRNQRLVEDSLDDIDNNINLLRCAADSAALGDAETQLIEVLYYLHTRLRRECDRLYTLL